MLFDRWSMAVAQAGQQIPREAPAPGADRGRGWHSLRRRFATDLDHLPLKRLMKLGGWKTPNSVMRYQKPTTEQLRESLKTRRNGIQAPADANRQ